MQNQKIVSALLVGCGMLVWFVSMSLMESALSYFDLHYGIYYAASIAVPIFLGFATAVVTLKMSKVTNFLTEVVVELKKVTWPSSKDTWAATFVVIVFVVLVSAMLGAIDLGWAYLVKEIIIQR